MESKPSSEFEKHQNAQSEWREKTMKGPRSAQEILSEWPAGIPESWSAKVHMYSSGGKFIAEREMQVSEFKDLLADLMESGLKFNVAVGSGSDTFQK